jgi:hypothetical protein
VGKAVDTPTLVMQATLIEMECRRFREAACLAAEQAGMAARNRVELVDPGVAGRIGQLARANGTANGHGPAGGAGPVRVPAGEGAKMAASAEQNRQVAQRSLTRLLMLAGQVNSALAGVGDDGEGEPPADGGAGPVEAG